MRSYLVIATPLLLTCAFMAVGCDGGSDSAGVVPPPLSSTWGNSSSDASSGPPLWDASLIDNDYDASSPTNVTDASQSDSSDAGPPSDCTNLEAPALGAAIISKPGPAPTLTEAAPPDGTYAFSQGSWYGASPLKSIRATLKVSGAKLVLGSDATENGGTSGAESFTFVAAGGTLVLVCRTQSGPLSKWLFPMNAGGSESAALYWDSGNNVLTIRVGSTTDLVFQPM